MMTAGLGRDHREVDVRAAREHCVPVSMALVRDVLAGLDDREVASKARPAAVFVTAQAWVSSIAATRRRALR